MNQSPENNPNLPPMPDIRDTEQLKGWMQQNIKRQPYDQMFQPDGTPMTEEEQRDVYINQTIAVIEARKARKSPDSVFEALKQSILDLTQPADPPTSKHT